MGHELAEKLTGLASRVNNLAVHHSGSESRELLALQDRLAKLTLAAIVQDLKNEHQDYLAAIEGMNEAIDFIGEADKKIKKVSEAIHLVSRAVQLAEKALSVTTRLL